MKNRISQKNMSEILSQTYRSSLSEDPKFSSIEYQPLDFSRTPRQNGDTIKSEKENFALPIYNQKWFSKIIIRIESIFTEESPRFL